MEKLAICKECRFAFSFKPWGTLAPSLADGPVFCTRCGKEALVAEGDFGGFFAAYHEAFPAALSKKQKREILELAKRIVAGKLKESEAIALTQRDPQTQKAFSTAAKWLFGIVGGVSGLSGVAAVVIMLVDGAERNRQHTQMMQRLDDIAGERPQPQANEGSRKRQKPSKRSRSKSQAQDQALGAVPLAGNAKKRSERKRRKRDPDVPFGGT